MVQAGRGRRAIAAALVCVLAITACGDDDEGASGTTAPATEDGSAASPGDPSGSAPEETASGPSGELDENIIGGVEADIGLYPWVVALRRPGKANNFCGGALVGPRTVMTAAHCVTDNVVVNGQTTSGYTVSAPATMEVVLGRTKLSDSTGQVIKVTKVFTAKAFNALELNSDFAVLELASAAKALPIALPAPTDTNFWLVGNRVLTLGWGCETADAATDTCGERAELSPLKTAVQTMQDRAVCTQHYGELDASTLCMASGDGVSNTCNGDSGGPWAIWTQEGKPYLVGITSFGKLGSGCSAAVPNGTSFVPTVTNADRWFASGLWNSCPANQLACTYG